LIEPLRAPVFSLPDLGGNSIGLKSLRGGLVLLHFCAASAPGCAQQLRIFQDTSANLRQHGLRIIGVNVDGAKRNVLAEHLSFPIVLATPEIIGVYNILYRYLFDRRRDLPVPTSFLVDREGMIVKIYQG